MCGSVDLSSFNKIIDRECIEAYATFKIKDKIPDLMPSMKAAKKLVLTEGAGDNCATEYIPPLQIQIQIQIFFFFLYYSRHALMNYISCLQAISQKKL